MFVTLGEAARQSGVSKSRISRAIRDGKLSAVRSTDTGSYRIEQSELQRYLDATNVTRAARATVATTLATVAAGELATGPEQAALEAQIAGLKQVADLLQRQLDDALSQRDKWEQAFQQQAQRIALPLPQPQAQQPPKRRWWPWRRAG